ncbi:ATP-dependent DNA helicase Q1 [Smittium culicis]|uniref:ATP-dependent DNA helicase Q1 n=1 Tax=Smittium culicis TaxID=133412 RepID=A0A1R1WXX3_9FUNG|nr:ATP-dependent DNA helicase Q1 [Smittium culicis]
MDPEKAADEISKIDNELSTIEQEISILEKKKKALLKRRIKNEKTIQLAEQKINQKKSDEDKIVYSSENFSWSKALKSAAKDYFGITGWKHSQIQAMNSILDKRDVFVIMPTGGGKSLCYQLTAAISNELEIHGIVAKSLSSENSVPETNSILNELKSLYDTENKKCKSKKKSLDTEENDSDKNDVNSDFLSYSEYTSVPFSQRKIKLLYLTPEKLVKSKRVVNLLEKLYSVGLVNQFVIDECHCCSEFGHDFRPDYKLHGS